MHGMCQNNGFRTATAKQKQNRQPCFPMIAGMAIECWREETGRDTKGAKSTIKRCMWSAKCFNSSFEARVLDSFRS